MMGKSAKKVELTEKEVGYLSSIVEARATKIASLGKKHKDKSPLREEIKIVDGINKKLLPA